MDGLYLPKRCYWSKALQSYVREGRKNETNGECEYLVISLLRTTEIWRTLGVISAVLCFLWQSVALFR